jgi:hypothetical protein
LNQSDSSYPEAYYTITQHQLVEPGFPSVARDRYMKEFLVKCRSAYRGAFTFQSKVDNRTLLPVSRAFDILKGFPITGLVKDAYNHLVAITMRPLTEGRSGEVLIPVIDDGNSFFHNTSLKMYIGLKAINFASANDVFELYERVITPRLAPLSSVYQITGFLEANRIFGFYLGSLEGFARITLPCGDNREDGEEIPVKLIQKQQGKSEDFKFEYMLSREIIFTENHTTYGEEDESTYLLERKQVEQLYEHLRLSFSNWIATRASPKLREEIENLVMVKPWLGQPLLTSREKFYRLKVILGATLQSWLDAEGKGGDTQNVLVRSDCIAIADGNEENCSGACKMVEGKCKIHIPEQVQVRSSPTSTRIPAAEYFINRLLDEIVRLPARRNELMTMSVKRLQIPTKNIHVGPEWILPENTIAWYDLLREKEVKGVEKPQFYEEFSRQNITQTEMDALAQADHLIPLPDSIITLFPEKYRNDFAVRIFDGVEDTERSNALVSYFGIRKDVCIKNKEDRLDETCIGYISKQYKVPVIQILTQVSPPIITGRLDISTFTPKSAAYVILPDLPEGPGLLVLRDDIVDTIPGELLAGPVMESILETKVYKRPVLARAKPVVAI